MSIINNTLLLGSGDEGYNLTRSLRFRSSASAYLNRTYVASPTDYRKYTFSAWVKLGALGVSRRLIDAGSGSDTGLLNINSDGTLEFAIVVSGSGTTYLKTNNVLRDPSAWYHIVFSCDTSVGSNQFKFYVNNVQASYSTNTAITTNYGTYLNSGSSVAQLGRSATYGQYFDGYLTEIYFVDGQTLTPSSFGETDLITGVWKPKRYAGTYGTNGFYLPFTDNSALTTSSNAGLGKDFSGNGNYWTTNNISITSGVTYDSMTDVPTLTSATAANFATFNPLSEGFADTSGQTIRNANLWVYGNAGYGFSTIGMTSGKWYAEFVCTSGPNSSAFGIWKFPFTSQTSIYGYQQTSYRYVAASGEIKNSGTTLQTYNTWGTNDIISVAYDADNGKVYYAKNGTWQGSANPATGTNPAVTGLSGTFVFGAFANNADCYANFGQRPFAYTPPTGYVALNTYNLPTSTIVKGNMVMDATLYTGNASTLTITNAAGFKPDFVWYKARALAYSHQLFDSVRGVTKRLVSNSTAAENTQANYLTSFNSNGFTIGNDAEGNTNASSYVAWQWQAGQGTTSSNTSGSITSTVSVNASAGFSVVTYTGTGSAATVGHGLGVAPSLIICKSRVSAADWPVYHQAIGKDGGLVLNLTNASYSSSNYWGSGGVTSSVFGVAGGGTGNNRNGDATVAYCFAPIAGYSAFGSYTGNGSTDGTFVYTGFRPKFVLVKSSSLAQNWTIYDTSRNPYNAANLLLYPLYSNAEDVGTGQEIDLLSNGFKLRNSNANENTNGATYIYMAFAENPFKNSLAR